MISIPAVDEPTPNQYLQSGKYSRPSKANPYDKVNTGINLVLIFVIISFVGMLISMLMGLLSSGDDIFAFIGRLVRLSGLVASGFGVAGLIYCLDVPEKTKTRPMIIAALCCVGGKLVVGELVLTLGGMLGVSLLGAAYLIMIAGLLVVALSLATVILFLLFLKRLAEITKQPAAVEELDFLFKLMFFIVLASIGGGFVAGFVPYGGFVLLLGLGGAEVYWVFRLTTLLQNLEFRKH